MPRISDKIAINNPKLDRRVKLSPEQKDEIRTRVMMHNIRVRIGVIDEAISQRTLAKEYGVSRRTITFILDPKKEEAVRENYKKRGGWRQYYNKNKHAVEVRQHRNYKKELFQKGLLTTRI